MLTTEQKKFTTNVAFWLPVAGLLAAGINSSNNTELRNRFLIGLNEFGYPEELVLYYFWGVFIFAILASASIQKMVNRDLEFSATKTEQNSGYFQAGKIILKSVFKSTWEASSYAVLRVLFLATSLTAIITIIALELLGTEGPLFIYIASNYQDKQFLLNSASIFLVIPFFIALPCVFVSSAAAFLLSTNDGDVKDPFAFKKLILVDGEKKFLWSILVAESKDEIECKGILGGSVFNKRNVVSVTKYRIPGFIIFVVVLWMLT